MQIGDRLLDDRYEVLDRLAAGGMGQVYRARDMVLSRDVAIKHLPFGDLTPSAAASLARKARFLARMDHPAVVTIHDLGRLDDGLFFIMPWVAGRSLRERLDDGPFEIAEAIEIGIQVAEALGDCHDLGIVHRDLRPENLKLAEDGTGLRVRVLDFALVSDATLDTLPSDPVAARVYRSPEQLAGRPPDGRGDLYALGAILFECLAGRPPFMASEISLAGAGLIHPPPPPLRELRAEVSPALDALIERCLARDPGDRPARGQDFAAALRRLRSQLRETRDAKDGVSTAAGLVGRRRERQMLAERFERALAGEHSLVLLGGDLGMGKSALVAELEERARHRGVRVLRADLAHPEGAAPFLVLCEWIREGLRGTLPATDTPNPSGPHPPPEPVDLTDLAPQLIASFPMLAEVPELRAMAGSVNLPPVEDPRILVELLARTLARLVGGLPMLLVAEGLHLGTSSPSALDDASRHLVPTPTLVVATFRNTEIGRSHALRRLLDSSLDDPHRVLLELSPLAEGEVRELAEQLLGGKVDPDFATQLSELGDGHPELVRALVQDLAKSGEAQPDETGLWGLRHQLREVGDALPESLRQMVEERLERLPAPQRRVLGTAAVLGRRFAERELTAALGDEVADLDEILDALIGDSIFEESRRARSDMLGFRRGYVRETLYQSLSPRRRRALHLRCGELLEERLHLHQHRVDPRLVEHFLAAGEAERAVRYAERGAREALAAFRPTEAAQLAVDGLDVVEDLSEDALAIEAGLRQILAEAWTLVGRHRAALEEAERAAAIWEALLDQARAVDAALLAARAAWAGRRIETARGWVEKGVALARSCGRRDALRELLNLAAVVANLGGESGAARRFLDEAEDLRPTTSPSLQDLAEGGELRVPLSAGVETLDPAAGNYLDRLEVVASVYESLTQLDGSARIVPWLARSFEANDDGASYRVELRDGVSFHDGRKLRAEDVKASFERLLRSPPPAPHHLLLPIRGAQELCAGRATELAGCRVLGDLELALELEGPMALFPAMLAHPCTSIVPRGTPFGSDSRRWDVAGTGPFRAVSADVGESGCVVLERNAEYWRPGRPCLRRLIFHGGVGPESALKEFRERRFGLIGGLRPADIESLWSDRDFAGGFRETPRFCTYFLAFRTQGGPFSEHRLRAALVSGLDVEAAFRTTLQRVAIRASGLLPPGMLGHSPRRPTATESRHPLDRDVHELAEQRRALGGLTVRFGIYPPYTGQYRAFWHALRSQLDTLGVRLKEVHGEIADLDELLRRGEVDAVLDRWVADYPDPDAFAVGLLSSRGGHLAGFGGSPEVDRLAEAGRRESDPAARRRLYQNLESCLDREALLVPFFHEQSYRFFQPGVQGIRLFFFPPEVRYDTLRIEGSRARRPTPGSGA